MLGSVVGKHGDQVFVGFLASSSLGYGKAIHLKRWDECKTYGEMAGFIIGRPIQYVAVNGWKLLRGAVQLFYLDKVSDYFFQFMGWSCSQSCNCCNRVAEFTSDYIKPIFVNSCTRKAVSWTYNHVLTPVGETISWTYDHVLTPVGQAIRTLAKLIFKTLLWDRICVPSWNRVIRPIFSAVFSRPSTNKRVESVREGWLGKCFSSTFRTLADWTIVPLWNHLLSPLCHTIGEFFTGVIGGVFGANTAEHRELKKPLKCMRI